MLASCLSALHRSYCEQKELYKSVTVPTNQNGKPRIVVFDAPGALKSFLRPAKRGLLYDFHQQQQKVRSMVRAFKQQGYELVVFLDCNIPDDKLTTWYRRRSVKDQQSRGSCRIASWGLIAGCIELLVIIQRLWLLCGRL